MLMAVGQFSSGPDSQNNLARASRQVGTAGERGAVAIVLPEYLMWWDPGDHGPDAAARAAEPLDGPFVTGLQEAAQRYETWVVAGILERHSLSDRRPYNTTVVIDESGTLVASYRKSHLYDAFANRESDSIAAGDHLFDPIEAPWGRTGLFVCYELRFPEVARNQALRGATVLLVPSAWVMGPMKLMHWRTLITSRAIENGSYLVAAAQCGNGHTGHSLIVDPMGEIIVEAGDEEVVLTGEVSQERVERVRRIVPSLESRREELYLARAEALPASSS